MCLAIIKIAKLWVRKRLPKKLLKSLSGMFSAAELSDKTEDVIANIPLYKLFQWQATHRYIYIYQLSFQRYMVTMNTVPCHCH